jgi:hypothetical protein
MASRLERPRSVLELFFATRDDPPEWDVFDRERSAEIAIRDRFLDPAWHGLRMGPI